MSAPETLIVGGGLIGLASALELARSGERVVLLDAGGDRRPASLAGAGLLAPLSHKQPDGPAGPTSVMARALWRDWLAELEDQTGETVEFDASGALVAAATAEERQVLASVRAQAEGLGEPNQPFGVDELQRLAPDIRSDVEEAMLLPAEARVDNVACFAALRKAVLRLGVEIVSGVTVEAILRTADGIEVTTGDGPVAADRGVLAAGCWTSLVSGAEPLPVRPVRGQMIRVRGADWPWRGMIRVGDHYAVRRGAADLLFGATVEEVGYADHTTAEGLAALTTALERAFPGLSHAPVVDSWSGLRPASEDSTPIVGAWRDWPLFVAAGHHRDGILYAPWTARQVAAWVREDAAWESVPAFSPNRFSPRWAGASPSV